MVFHAILALHKLRHEDQPNLNPAAVSHNPYPSWHNQSGISCGPAGNNCAVEGNGRRGPGPVPLPGHISAIFHGSSRLHDGDHSLFDLRRARSTLSGHSASQVLPQQKRGFGSAAYNSTPTPLYSISHAGHFSNEAISHTTTNSFYGGLASPVHTADVKSMWGQRSRGAQFSASSMVPQANHSLFNFGLHDGVISMASVSVHSGSAHSNSYSWDVNRTAASVQQHAKTTQPAKPYWAAAELRRSGFLAPEPFTQYPAESVQGYSSI
jgi:hypothetical protein